MSSMPRILTQLPIQLLDPVVRAHPEVDIVQIPTKGPIEDGIEGEILLTYTWGAPNLADVFERGIRWVHAYGTGVDTFPFDLLGDRPLTCSRGASATVISEWVIAALLAFEKQLPESWIEAPVENWNSANLGSLQDRKLALIGFGGIAQAIARRALPFGMRVEALRRTEAKSPVEGVRIVSSKQELLSDADHVVVAAPETPLTTRFINDAAFGWMKPGVHIVNIARGGLVDQDALKRALDSGRIARATLDCVTPEPLPENHWMYTHPRIRLSPHISWSAPQSHLGLVDTFVENVGHYLRGEQLESLVDPDQGY
jgi:phosphoglycerate dehydrogenase-like enzyme